MLQKSECSEEKERDRERREHRAAEIEQQTFIVVAGLPVVAVVVSIASLWRRAVVVVVVVAFLAIAIALELRFRCCWRCCSAARQRRACQVNLGHQHLTAFRFPRKIQREAWNEESLRVRESLPEISDLYL